jgi:hypothetical protein
VETDEPDDPSHIGVLSVNGTVVQTGHLVPVIKEFWWWTSGRVRHTKPPSCCLEIADNRYRAKLPENPVNIVLSAQNGWLIYG